MRYFLFCFFFVSSLFAETPQAPVILDFGPDGCIPKTEICGDGIDQNCDGSDLSCGENDKDRDGFNASKDCDDSSRKIYPGISVSCNSSCGQGTKTCKKDGSFSPCSCTPLCEAKGDGNCYYISKLTGKDSNPGTFKKPWKTTKNITSYYSASERPPKWINLKPGDVVYFMPGIYKKTYEYKYQGTKALFFRGLHGTKDKPIILKAYPGVHPVIAPFISNNKPVTGLEIIQSNNIVIEGFEITRTYGNLVRIDESKNIELKNLWIHHADGVGANNISGIYVRDGENINIHHNLIHDVYDHSEKNYNSRNIAFFSGGNNKVLNNVIFQSPRIDESPTGGCVVYKHKATIKDSVFEVGHNILWNCSMTSIGSGTPNSHIHHNLLVNSFPITFTNFGGGTLMRNNIVEYNTIIGNGLLYEPTTEYGQIGKLTFRKNIVVDNSKYSSQKGIITISPFGEKSIYNQVVNDKNLDFNSNCYFNSNDPIQFNLFSTSKTYGSTNSLSVWKSRGYGKNSKSINPKLNKFHIPTKAECMDKGWNAK